MFSSLLVLLAPMGSENCTLNKHNKPLFYDPRLSINPTVCHLSQVNSYSFHNRAHTKPLTQVRIVKGNWDEARLVPHVAGILLREMFGLSVEYKSDGETGTGSKSSRMYDMLADDEADLALTLWPAKFLRTNRSAALSKSCKKSLSERCVATVGNQAYKARSGWFVTANVSAVRGKEAEWSTVVSLYNHNHTENLMKAHEIQQVENLCKSFPNALTYGGTFDCEDGSWMHDKSTCCSRIDYKNDLCGARKPCVALMVDNPSYDEGVNEGIVGRLAQAIRVSNQDGQAVGIQIVYGNVAEEVEKAEASDRSLLIYSWLPRVELMTPNDRFVRITLESFYHCMEGAERDVNLLAKSSVLAEPFLRGVAACDFPVEQVEKAVVWRLQQPSATNAKLFVNHFNLSSTQLTELLALEKNLSLSSKDSAEAEEIACEWLNRNTDVWEEWLPLQGRRGHYLYDFILFQWRDWVIVCSAWFLMILGCAAFWQAKKMLKERSRADPKAEADVESQDEQPKGSVVTHAVDEEDAKPMDKEEAETLAKDLAYDCYMSAVKASSSLLGVAFAMGFLFYYTFKDGVPPLRDLSHLTLSAFFLGPMWLLLGLGGLLYRTKCQPSGVPTCLFTCCNDADGTAAKVRSYKVAFSGVMWFSTYLLWALAPIFMTPLISDYGPGTDSALLSDVLTVLAVLKTMGESIIDAEEFFTKMLNSSDKAKRVAVIFHKHKQKDLEQADTAAPSRRTDSKRAKQNNNAYKRLKSPLKAYLAKARGYLFNPETKNPWVTRFGFVLFAIGQLFVAASSGFFKILLFETWLGDGLNKLSLEVTISCAVLMLTLALIDWAVELLPSGEDIVRRMLRDELIKAADVGKPLIQMDQRPGSPKTHPSRTVSDESEVAEIFVDTDVEAEAKANEIINKAKSDANEIKKKAETDANEIKEKAEADANEIKEKAETDANEIKEKAEADANEIKEKAEADANEIKEKAEADANEIKEKAETDANEIKEKAETDANEIKEKAETDANEIKEKAEDAKAKADQIIAAGVEKAKAAEAAAKKELEDYKAAEPCRIQ